MGTPREPMGAERQKIRVAEWLYRWNLSMGILGIVFTILTFLGVFTIVLGPLFTQQCAFTFLETALVLLVIVLAVISGFGVYLDKVIAFWAAQATVATVRNPYLVTTLYQKELLALIYIQAPMLKALRALLETQRMDDATKQSFISELDRSLARVEQSIRDKRWPIEHHDRVYLGLTDRFGSVSLDMVLHRSVPFV